MPMGDRADGGRIVERALDRFGAPSEQHSLGTTGCPGPNGGSRGVLGVVRPTLDPEEGWGCGWTPQTLTTLHFPRPRWRSAAATPY